MILKCHCLPDSRDTFGLLLYRVDLSMVVLTEENHSNVVSSRLMTGMIISVPQIFNVDFFVCVDPILDVQKPVPILALQDPVSFIKGRKPCGCKQKCLLYSC